MKTKINHRPKQKDKFYLAIRFYETGDSRSAVLTLEELIKNNPKDYDALNFLGGINLSSGNFSGSIEYFQKVVSIFPLHPTAYYNMGLAFQNLGQDIKAEKCYKKALSINPQNLDALNNLGVICFNQKRKEEAFEYYKKIIDLDKRNSNALNNLGNIKASEKKFSEAESFYLKAIEIEPNNSTYLFNLADCYINQNELSKAQQILEKIIELNPAYYHAYNHLGVILIKKNEYDKATQLFEKSIKIKEDFWEAYHNLGLCLEKLGRNSEAVSVYKRALELNGNNSKAMIKLAHIFLEEGNYSESEKYLNKITDDEAKVISYVNLGVVKLRQGNLNEGIEYTFKALKENDQIAVTHYNFSHALMLLGNFKEGWKEYEWRKKLEDFKARNFYGPELTAESLHSINGKKVLVSSEQGYGDTFHFVRYLPKLKELGAYVIFECEATLVGILKNCAGIDKLIIANSSEEPHVEYDLFVYLLSLPGLFNTDETNIPANIPYLFADEEKIDKWKSILGDEKKLKVGIVWAGNPNHKNDKNRSCKLEQFKSLFEVPGVQFYSLQKGKAVEQIYELGNTSLIDLDSKLTSFEETAAAIMNLDLVISVDTSVAHLAGALGKEVWLMLPFFPDWRWFMERSDSPWYPSMQLYRQKSEKKWDSVINEIKGDMEKLIGEKFGEKVELGLHKQKIEKNSPGKILYLGLANGENYGWGICSRYLKKELSRKISIKSLENIDNKNGKVDGDLFHALTGVDFESITKLRGTRNFAYTFFENELTEKSIANANKYEIIFGGSTWCKEKMESAGIKNTGLLIQGVDPELFYPEEYNRRDNLFVIFSGGKFEFRKGQDLVIKAFEILQKKYDDIILINAWHNFWAQSISTMSYSQHIKFDMNGKTWHEFISHNLSLNNIDLRRVFILPNTPNEKMRELYLKTDIGLFPNRCEGGTNLVLMEYMACGKPVVASYNSGHKDILTESNSIRLNEMKKIHLQNNGKLFADWEEPLLDEIISKIEFAYNNREKLKSIGRQAASDMKKFTWEKTAVNLLSQIY